MIKSLTDEQKERHDRVLREVYENGISTERCNRSETEKSLLNLVREVKPKWNPEFIWFDEPISAILGIHLLKNTNLIHNAAQTLVSKTKSTNLNQVLKKLAEQAPTIAKQDISKNLSNIIKNLSCLFERFFQITDASIQNKVKGVFGQILQVAIQKINYEELKTHVSEFYLFSGNEGWVTFYKFCESLDLSHPYSEDNSKKLDLWEKLIKQQGSAWIAVFENFAIIIDRPVEIHMDENHVVHNDKGPAVKYKDGFAIWAIHGLNLSTNGEKIVLHPELQTIEEIEAEKNNDIRALRIERFGWLRYIKESGMTVIDERVHPRDGLKETLYAGKNNKRLVVFDPATAKQVALGVPSEVKTCAEAQDWMSHGADQVANCRT